jgi:hypothetical protein
MKNEMREVIAADLTTRGIEPPLSTAEAAAALNRAVKTLHKWACEESGPIRPVRIGRRLAWSAADVRALLGGHPPPLREAAPLAPPEKLAPPKRSTGRRVRREVAALGES